MSVVVIGLEHKKAPFDLLERVTVPEAEVGKVLAALRAHENVQEAALVSTCLRTEVYAVVDRFHDAVDDVTKLLATQAGCDRSVIEEHQSVFFDRGAASHLFRIAAGLESAVPGETEVLGQVRRSMERAADESAIGPTLHGMFQAAIHTGRRVRTETAISRGTVSFSYAAVELAEAHLGQRLAQSRCVVLGAGGLGAGVLTALLDERRDQRPSEVVVVNRTLAHAEALVAEQEPTIALGASSLEELPGLLQGASLLVTCVEATEPLVSADLLESAGAELLVLDLGMPRNVVAAAGALPGIELLDIGHLRSAVEQAMDERRAEVQAAETVVVDEVARYLEDVRGRGAAPVVVSLRERLEEIRIGELARKGSELSSLSDEQREAVEGLTRSILAKILHEPTASLKESAGTPRGERLVEAARLLFGL